MKDISRRRIIKLGAGLIAFVPAAKILASPSFSHAETASSALSVKVGAIEFVGLSLGLSEAAVAGRIGKPERIELMHGVGTPVWYYPDKVISFWGTSSGEIQVRDITLTLPTSGMTEQGIRVGSSIDDLSRIYGKYLKQHQSGFNYDISSTIRFSFRCENKTVVSVNLGDYACATCGTITGPRGRK